MAKIAVYAICRDEAKHAARFMASMDEADGVFVLDTGSQDESPRILRDLGATVEAETILPWRFDTARNRALAMVPPDFDICICCDLDEVFAPGWRQALEDAWTPGTTRMAYPFYYDARGSFFYRSLIHTRRGYIWHWPIHEALLALGPEQVGRCDGLRLFHLPDPEKSRAAYLPMLEQAVQAAPDDVRMLFYLGREYVCRGRYAAAVPILRRHIGLEQWDAQKAASLRMLSLCYERLGDHRAAEDALIAGIDACPHMREGYILLGRRLLNRGDRTEARKCLSRALAITRPDPDYFNEGWAWDGTLERLLQEA